LPRHARLSVLSELIGTYEKQKKIGLSDRVGLRAKPFTAN